METKPIKSVVHILASEVAALHLSGRENPTLVAALERSHQELQAATAKKRLETWEAHA